MTNPEGDEEEIKFKTLDDESAANVIIQKLQECKRLVIENKIHGVFYHNYLGVQPAGIEVKEKALKTRKKCVQKLE